MSHSRSLDALRLTEEEATEVRAARRAEIERRAALLEPPMSPNALARNAAFKAAIQIPTPLNDNAWEAWRMHILEE